MVAQPALSFQSPQPGSLAAGWSLLHEAGQAVAELAQLGPEVMLMDPHDFETRAIAAGTTRHSLAARAIDDCAAQMHYGLTALISAREGGQDGTAAALTLWREFHRAREALLNLTATG